MCRIDASRSPWTIRRSVWQALGGFDPELPALEDYEFRLRAILANRSASAVDQPLVIRTWRTGALYRQAWDRDRHDPAVAQILRRHGDVLAPHLGAILYEGQRARAALRGRNRELLRRREADLLEIARLKDLARELRQELPEADQWSVDLGDARRTSPVSRDWGYERGAPVDRHYIETFLASHASDIKGDVLEVQENDYTRQFGGDRVSKSDVIDLDPANERATVVSDLRAAANVPAESYDCIILTQTLHVIDDMAAVVAECARILKPGGVILATLPAASRVCVEYGADADFWRVTDAGARRLFSTAFNPEHLDIASRGNVLTTAAFLYGLGSHEVTGPEYDVTDPFFPMLVTVRARKAWRPAAAGVLLYHRVADVDTDPHHLAVAPGEFERQMIVIRDSYTPLPLDEFVALAARNALPDGAVAITFDDGYVDNATTASPILQRLGLPATFFLTTDRLQGDPPYEYWWDVLSRLLLQNGREAWPAELRLSLPAGERHWPTATAIDRKAAHRAIYETIVADSAALRESVIGAIREWAGDRGTAVGPRRVTASEARDLARRPGHAVGAHGVRHLMLTRQPAQDRDDEIRSSKIQLEALLGRSVDLFAYPFGAWDADTRASAQRAGFTAALACGDSAVSGVPDLHAIPRLDPASRGDRRFEDWLRDRVQANRPAISPSSSSAPTTPSSPDPAPPGAASPEA